MAYLYRFYGFFSTGRAKNGLPVEVLRVFLDGSAPIAKESIIVYICQQQIGPDMIKRLYLLLSILLPTLSFGQLMPESEYRARKSRKLRRELQEFALANGVTMMN